MKHKLHYDRDYDNLIISRKRDNERVKGNFELGEDIVISVTGNGKIVGIELRDASGFLQELGINPKILEQIKSGELIIEPKRNALFISFKLYLKPKKEQKIPIAQIPSKSIN